MNRATFAQRKTSVSYARIFRILDLDILTLIVQLLLSNACYRHCVDQSEIAFLISPYHGLQVAKR